MVWLNQYVLSFTDVTAELEKGADQILPSRG